jgi:membrane fusion protein (multidrug efflux system)
MKKLIVGIVLAGIVVGAVLWWRKADPEDEADGTKATAQVSVASVRSELVARELVAYGSIEPSAQGLSLVTLPYDCVVRSVASTVGTRVSKGSVLMVIDAAPDARLQLDSARSDATLANRSLASSRQRYDLRLGTADDLRIAEQGEEDARLKLESLEHRGLSDDVQALLAPSDGVLLKLDVSPGMVVTAGTLLASVAKSGALLARVGIETSDAGSVALGDKALLYPTSRPNAKATESKVGGVGAATDTGTGTVDVRITLPEGEAWRPGERVEARIEVERKAALVVPSGAILPDGDREVVYTVKAGKALRHVVETGIRSGDDIEIARSDLVVGDSVVVQGNYELSDGMDVILADKPDKAAKTAPAEEKR